MQVRWYSLSAVALGACLLAAAVGAQDGDAAVEDPCGWQQASDLPRLPAEPQELLITTVPAVDGRFVLGFLWQPLDGRVDSWAYNGMTREWNRFDDWHYHPAGYRYLNDPGYHLTLATSGVDYICVRGGFVGDLYTGVTGDDGPGAGALVAAVQSIGTTTAHGVWRKVFERPLQARRLSFFWRQADGDNTLADIGCYRLRAQPVVAETGATRYVLGDVGAAPEDLAAHVARRFADGARQFCYLQTGSAGATVPVQSGVPLHLATPILPSGTPVGGVRVQLQLTGVEPGNKLLLVVQDPLNRMQELLRIDLAMPVAGPINCQLDFPDQLIPAARLSSTMLPVTEIVQRNLRYRNWPALTGAEEPAGRRLWVTLVSEQGGSLSGTVSVLPAVRQLAAAAYHQARLRQLKGLFSMLSEARPWMGLKWSFGNGDSVESVAAAAGPRQAPLLEVHETLCELYYRFPDDPIIQQYWGWFHQRWLSVQAPLGLGDEHYDRWRLPELLPLPGVPRWAQLQSRLQRLTGEMVRWWIANRRASNGEFGGTVNDDTCLMPWFAVPALVDDSLLPMVQTSAAGVMENALRYTLQDGLCKNDNDYGHGYEDGINQTALMPMLAYGQPQYIENAMRTSHSLARICPLIADGYRQFVPHDSKHTFGANLLAQPLPTAPEWWRSAPDNRTSAVNFHPMLVLAWYNHHPLAIEILKEYGEGTEQWRRCGGYDSGPHFAFGLYWLTGDPKYIVYEPWRDGQVQSIDGNGATADFAMHCRQWHEAAWWPEAQRRWGSWTSGAMGWAAGQDRQALTQALEVLLWGVPGKWAAGGFETFSYMLTDAEMFTDRIFLYQNRLLGQTYLGGFVHRNNYWPSMAISWEGLHEDFAALVLAAGRDQLRVNVINLSGVPRIGRLRPWQLDHGRYRLRVGPDANDDGVMDSVVREQTLTLQRLDSTIEVALPPRQLQVYELTQIERLSDIYDRADLALSSADIVRGEGRAQVTVHSIGVRPAPATFLAAIDNGGTVLAQVAVPELEAPLDFLPRRVTVDIELPAGAAAIVIDPEGTVPELTELNNRVTLVW